MRISSDQCSASTARTVRQAERGDIGSDAVARIVRAEHGDPFSVLGMHVAGGGDRVAVRCMLPGAAEVEVVDPDTARCLARLERIDEAGFFAGSWSSPAGSVPYRLRVRSAAGERVQDDPYAFACWLSDEACHALSAGVHAEAYAYLGAHTCRHQGVAGTGFAVWAPNAARVSVVGTFNGWDGRVHPMRHRVACGVWEIFLPHVGGGELYKYEVRTADGRLLLKSDPYAREVECAPLHASRVPSPARFAWRDHDWLAGRARLQAADAPIAIYEVHLGSWRHAREGQVASYDSLAEELVPYAVEMGFTHLELMPVCAHPFRGSWGYQPTALFAPSPQLGDPDALRRFVDRCHRAGLGVILDWVPGHFPRDDFGLACFDGTCLYEHQDPRIGVHKEWGTLAYDLGRREVCSFLVSNALFWLREFHIDGLRVDAVSSMLYRDYGRSPGEWLPNRHGGRENLEAVDFFRCLNDAVHAGAPCGAIMVAEESTAWQGVSGATRDGGLGFDFKWNMGWMHDTLAYARQDPLFRGHHHERLTFGILYAWSERFILPLSHDEVVHGKGSLLGKMPGDESSKFGNLRVYLAFQYLHPGKKLIFMGGEFGQAREWCHDRELDWHLLDHPLHRGLARMVMALNRLYRALPCLHQLDCDSRGFDWIDCSDRAQSVFCWRRSGRDPWESAVVICNFTPVARPGYRVGLPRAGGYRAVFNSDAREYGGHGMGDACVLSADPMPWHGQPFSGTLALPPLAAIVLLPEPLASSRPWTIEAR